MGGDQTKEKQKCSLLLCIQTSRHPDTDVEEFKDHLEKVFQNISKENKLIYLMGDFNFDLLNYETDTATAGFVNSIVQFGFLPLIHQPTRITGRSATIIDNIFANNFEHESISGNLLLKISDHLPQFSTIKKSFTWIIKPSTTTNMTAINLMKISSEMIFKFKLVEP